MKQKTKLKNRKINESKILFEKINNLKTSTKTDQEKIKNKKNTQIANIRNERDHFSTNSPDTERIIRQCYKQIYAKNFNNTDEMYQFTGKHKLPFSSRRTR